MRQLLNSFMQITKKIAKRIIKKTGYEIHKIRHFTEPVVEQKRLLKGMTNPIIIDVGAQFGQSIKRYLKHFPDATIYSFEPFKESFIELSRYVKDLNNTNIHIFNVALGNRSGNAKFYSNECSATNSLLPSADKGEQTWGKGFVGNTDTQIVDILKLDDFIKNNNIEHVDILKMDTQGTEYQVIEGAQNALRENKIKIIFTEIITMPSYNGQKELYEILEIMHSHDFVLYKFFSASLVDGYLRQLDAIFLNKHHKFPEINQEITQYEPI